MSTSLANDATLADQAVPVRGGLLQNALPAPDGWERGGLEVLLNGAAEPLLLDRCFTVSERDLARPEPTRFIPFQIETGSTCSTLSMLDHDAVARDRLAATTEYAVGRQLALDVLDLGTPSLDDAQSLGEAGGVASGVGCLEEQAALAGFGSRWFLHASPRTAAALRDAGMIDSNRRSPSGAQWIMSTGYAGTEPGRVWATGTVWVGQGAPSIRSVIEHRRNDDFSIADRSALVAFDPSILLSIDVPVGDCPTTN